MQPRKALCLAMAATRVLEKSCPWQRWNLNPSPQRDLSFNATPKTAWPRYTLCICSTGRFDWKKARPKLILQKEYTDQKRIAGMHCKSLWIKVSAKCINVNVPREHLFHGSLRLGIDVFGRTDQHRIDSNRQQRNLK